MEKIVQKTQTNVCSLPLVKILVKNPTILPLPIDFPQITLFSDIWAPSN